MASRLELHEVLCNILGSKNVYYQPPASVVMKYPAIRYSRNDIQNTFADDTVYSQSYVYEITLIDKNPDSEYVAALSQLPTCRYNRHYVSDNLNHDVFLVHF